MDTHKAFAACVVAQDIVDLTYKNASIQTVYRLLVKFLCELHDPAEQYIAVVGIPTNKRLEMRCETDADIDFFDNNYFVYYPKSKEFPKMTYAKLKKFNGQIFERKLIEGRHNYFIEAIACLFQINNIKFIMYNANEVLDPEIKTPKEYFDPYDVEKTRDYIFDQELTHLNYADMLKDYYNDNCR